MTTEFPSDPGGPSRDGSACNDLLGRLPTVARLYYTGHGSRRYKRASVRNGPGEALTFTSLAEERVRQAVALERERWATAAAKVLCEPGNPDYRDALRAVLAGKA